MSKNQLLILVALLICPPTAVVLYSAITSYNFTANDAAPKYQKLRWQDLKKLNLENDYTPPGLEKINNTRVHIPGFVVPLEDEDTKLTEFLLVPTPQACIHVPPPPANQMILVKMDPKSAPKRSWGAVWIKGRLQITTAKTQYGKISYRLYGELAEAYQE